MKKPFRYGGRRGLREQLESTHLVGGQRVHYSRVGGQLQRVDRDNNWKVQLDIRWRRFLAAAQRAAQRPAQTAWHQ